MTQPARFLCVTLVIYKVKFTVHYFSATRTDARPVQRFWFQTLSASPISGYILFRGQRIVFSIICKSFGQLEGKVWAGIVQKWCLGKYVISHQPLNFDPARRGLEEEGGNTICDRSRQLAWETHNQGKKNFAHFVNFSKNVLPCLIIPQSCYFDKNNQTFRLILQQSIPGKFHIVIRFSSGYLAVEDFEDLVAEKNT